MQVLFLQDEEVAVNSVRGPALLSTHVVLRRLYCLCFRAAYFALEWELMMENLSAKLTVIILPQCCKDSISSQV